LGFKEDRHSALGVPTIGREKSRGFRVSSSPGRYLLDGACGSGIALPVSDDPAPAFSGSSNFNR
jgi:hypothetical protein